MKKFLFSLLVCSFIIPNAKAQDGFPAIPGIDEGQFAVYNQASFLTMIGASALSYGLAEFVFKNDENLNFYQARVGLMGMQDGYTVINETFGIEKRVAPWFALAIELNNQQWFSSEGNGAGIGLNTHYRWYALGKKKVSPFIEAGAGVFQGFSEFPANGTNFTFHLTTNLGVEYTRSNQDRLRLTYGHLHQSNNDLFDVNPGIVGNGLTVSYAWFWAKSKW